MFQKLRNRLASQNAPAPAPAPASGAGQPGSGLSGGVAAEARALQHLQQQGLQLVQRNYRVARGPAARGGEIDLVMRDAAGTLVFVEVRSRSRASQGGAAASIGKTKQARIIFAAQHFLMRYPSPPPCRFDVVAIDGGELQWLQAAFAAG